MVEEIIKEKDVIGLIFETRRKSLFSSIVSFVTSSDYTHVEFLLEDGYTYGSKNFKGVGLHRIEDFKNPKIFLFNKKLINCTLVYNSIYIDQNGLQKNIKKFFIDTLGKKYDWTAVLTYYFKKAFNNPNRWYCSEYCYEALIKSGLPLINVTETDKLILPSDLSKSILLRRVD